jgi:uncharacterized protein
MAGARSGASVEERLKRELSLIKENIAGVHGTVIATSDGFLVLHDLPDLDPSDLAALLSATRAVTSQGIAATGRGQFRESVSRGTLGYLAVYAAGDSAILAVIGDDKLNIALLHFRIHGIIERIATYTAEFRRWSRSAPPGKPVVPSHQSHSGLPVRRPRSY